MLQRDLRKIANESIFNPKKPEEKADEILMELGDTNYWVTKAREHLIHASSITTGSKGWHDELKQAIKLLILARTKNV